MKATLRHLAIAAAFPLAMLLAPATAFAHCDGLDGPVVGAGRRALEAGDLKHAIIWVQPAQETEIRAAFERARLVRGLGATARQLADQHFLETLVRVHRAGEGAPYDGLKPAGRDLGPAIPAADAALESGSPDALAGLVTRSVREGLNEQFEGARAKRRFASDDVDAGREYVEAYVRYVHYVEGLYEAARKGSAAHGEEAARHPH